MASAARPPPPLDEPYTAPRRASKRHAPTLSRTSNGSKTQRRSLRHVRDSTEDLTSKARMTATSSLSSAVSRGRSFRVGNIGHDGLIYLRPVDRAVDTRGAPPITPPDSVEKKGARQEKLEVELHDYDWRESFLSGSGTFRSDEPRQSAILYSTLPSTPPQQPRSSHRPHSFAAVDNDQAGSSIAHGNPLQIIIDQASPQRPSFAEKPLLDTTIPHYKLGKPEISGEGSVTLHSSLNTVTTVNGDLRSSVLSREDYAKLFPIPPGAAAATSHQPSFNTASRDGSSSSDFLAAPVTQRRTISSELLPLDTLPSPLKQHPNRLKMASMEIEDPSVVRVSPITNEIIAATPSRLVAHIASPNLLDYELLSDFFLTFRCFMTTSELAVQLIQRLKWAFDRPDDFGRIVRVRTFVAIRHWILNYFIDDFLGSYDLRVQFCELVNNVHQVLRDRTDGSAGDTKILSELKKCWTRTCALYWDVPGDHGVVSGNDNVVPGDRMNSRKSDVSGPIVPVSGPKGLGSLGSDDSLKAAAARRTQKPRSMQQPNVSVQRQATSSTVKVSDFEPAHRTRDSDASAHIISCSMPPVTAAQRARAKASSVLGPRPAPPTSSTQAGKLSSGIPLASTGQHRRSGSFSDSLRDHRSALAVPKASSPEDIAAQSTLLPGSLVRGELFEPLPPYVETVAPGSPIDEDSRFNFNTPQSGGTSYFNMPGSPGVKKLLGSMRRALSHKQPSLSNSAHDWERQSVRSSSIGSGPRPSMATSRISGAPKRKLVGGRARLRIDLLSANVNETRKAMLRDGLDEPKMKGTPSAMTRRASQPASQMLTTKPKMSTVYSTAITTGSRSIVIVDDTGNAVPEALEKLLGPTISAQQNRNMQNQTLPSSRRQTAPLLMQATRGDAGVPKHGKSQHQSRQPDELSDLPISGSPPQTPEENRDTTGMESTLIAERVERSYSRQTFHSHSVVTPPTPEKTPVGGNRGDEEHDAAPIRQLRRRPGGDLRAVDHVHDLEDNNQAASPESGTISGPPRIPVRKSSMNATQLLASTPEGIESNDGRTLTIHSSHANMRPSFEQQVAKIAQIPDDEDDDGGRESALLKLEGRYDRSSAGTSPQSQSRAFDPPSSLFESTTAKNSIQADTKRDRELGIVDNIPLTIEGDDEVDETEDDTLQAQHNNLARASDAASEASYSSIPLLERGVSHGPAKRRTVHAEWRNDTPTLRQSSHHGHNGTSERIGKNFTPSTSSEALDLNAKFRNMSPKSKPTSSHTHRSFFLEDNQSLSSLPSLTDENYATDGAASEGMRSFYHSDSTKQVPSVHEMPEAPVSLPPIIIGQDIPQSIARNEIHEDEASRHVNIVSKSEVESGNNPADRPFQKARSALDLRDMQELPLLSTTPAAAHLPFVLSYDSLLIAQQFTLIEKDALSEVDWRELIELRWKQSSYPVHNWAEHISSSTPQNQALRNGIDISIARFNIMVKWTASEIVLTQDLTERVACVVKFIHIAEHARRLRNWATMYQITTALVSSDCTRLRNTWAHVPEEEKRVLEKLESLIMPVRNFANLRHEMEVALNSGSPGGVEVGCIPFIGIYTHDLIYNAQKPAFARQLTTEGEPLVNFERYHTAATIVKSLLRLLEASSSYQFQPVPDVISRCLWIAALRDPEIARRSRALEP